MTAHFGIGTSIKSGGFKPVLLPKPDIKVIQSYFTVLSSLFTGFVTILIRWVPLVKQELLILPEHLRSTKIFSEVTRSLILCVWFVVRCLSFCNFSFGNYVVCPASIYGFGLTLWYLLATVLSVLLWFIDSDYPFGIFWPLCCLFFFDL